MKDRIPAPGRANRVRITQDDGQAVEGVLTYADDVIQEGSRYTKQNVLPDDVCDTLNLDRRGAEPKDAFNACWAVGDIKTTTRTSLGASWHVCDGSNFAAAAWPALSAIIGPSIQNGFKPYKPLPSAYQPSAVQYVNGHYIVLGSTNNWRDGRGCIAYTDSLTRPWTSTELPTIGEGKADWVDIIWDGVQYVALALFFPSHSGGYHSGFTACATQLSGPWSLHDIKITCDNYPRPKLQFSDGIYSFATRGYSELRPTFFCSTAPGGEWSSFEIGPKGMEAYAAVHALGYYIACGRDGGTDEGFYAYSANAVDWTTVSVSASMECLIAANGFVAAADSDGKIRYTTNPAGNWSAKQVLSSINSLSYVGKFVAIGHNGSGFEAAEASTPGEAWSKYSWSADIPDSLSDMSTAASNDGVITAYMVDREGGAQVYGYSDEMRTYPKIDFGEPVKAFIRVK